MIKKHTQDNDKPFPNPPSDGISSLAINGAINAPSTMIVAGSWDNGLHCYELQNQGMNGTLSNIIKQGQIMHEAPVLCCDIGSDGITTFSGGCDSNVRMWNPTQGPTAVQVIGKHDQPIRNMKFLPNHNVLVTGSWDKSVRIWDTRSPNAVANIQLTERVYAMDAKGEAIVVGTADKKLHVYNIANLGQKAGEFDSSLKYQTRTISIFADMQGFAMGCIEGRVAVEYFNDMQNKIQAQRLGANAPKTTLKNFVFKCHRDGTNIFSVNSIDFHHYNTFCTAGSDGTFCWWDKEARHRLAAFEKDKNRCPITVVKFNPMGNSFFYGLSYDWSKGAEHNNPALGNQIMYHPVVEADITPKKTN